MIPQWHECFLVSFIKMGEYSRKAHSTYYVLIFDLHYVKWVGAHWGAHGGVQKHLPARIDSMTGVEEHFPVGASPMTQSNQYSKVSLEKFLNIA